MQQTTQGWHVAEWGLWGWIETGLKLVAIGAGFLAFIGSSAAGSLMLADNPRLGAVIVLGLMTFATLGVLVLRYGQREIISMIYAILNVLGHIGMLIALLRMPDQGVLPIIFGVFFVLGELAKQRFLSISGFTEAGQTTGSMVMFSRVIAVMYAIFTVLMLI